MSLVKVSGSDITSGRNCGKRCLFSAGLSKEMKLASQVAEGNKVKRIFCGALAMGRALDWSRAPRYGESAGNRGSTDLCVAWNRYN